VSLVALAVSARARRPFTRTCQAEPSPASWCREVLLARESERVPPRLCCKSSDPGGVGRSWWAAQLAWEWISVQLYNSPGAPR
jgi:hypothetical protein